MADVGSASVGAMFDAVAAGELWLEDGVGQACAAHCQELVDELDVRIDAISDLSRASGFGGFDSALQLQAGFARKAEQARDKLVEFRGVVENMRDVFVAADRSYTASSDSHVLRIGAADGQGIA